MKKKTKLIPLTINRKKWARGGYNGESLLLNDEGNMCCLGFACRTAGFSAGKIRTAGTPQQLQNRLAEPGLAFKKLGKMVILEEAGEVMDSDATDDAITVNDDDKISDKMREYRLKPILKKLGFAAKFVGPTRDDQ